MQQALMMGIDLGAGSLKVTILSEDGAVVNSASADIHTAMPKPGWSEQDPEAWYRGLCAAVPAALASDGLEATGITAISFSGGAHTPVLLDEQYRVIRPAILWSDQRSGAEARELEERAGEMIRSVSLNSPNATWTLPQLNWLQRHEPTAIAKVKHLLVAKDYLRFRLTGLLHTDSIDAVGTLMCDAHSRTWSREICGLIDWDMNSLPPIVEPASVVGEVSSQGAKESGLAAGTAVVAGTMDTAVECFGAGSVDPGQGVIKLATAGAVSVVNPQIEAHQSVIDYPHVILGQSFSITGTNSCASAHRWLRDQFFGDLTPDGASAGARSAFEIMDDLAADIGPGAEGVIFHPYLQGERSPYWDPLLRADFIGVTMRHTRAHFVRALYEGIAFSLFDCIQSLAEEGLALQEVRLIGGGSKSPTWRQIVSDVIGMPVSVPANGDASFGAALLAGVGFGVFPDERAAVARCVKLAHHCEPDANRHAHYQNLFSIYKESQAVLAGINHRIGEAVSADH
jgi:xylulokinase